MKQLPANYSGRILKGVFSYTLKKRTLSVIQASAAFDTYNFPLMPYITAWNQEDNTIWYEFVGQQFLDLLETNATDISKVFRDSIQDQRIFHYTDLSQSEVEEEIITRQQISRKRHNLRRNVQMNKQIEAVYQIILPSDRTIWLKDRGRIENFPNDTITLTYGCLTDVTKEMEQKELLEHIGYFDDLTGLPKRNIMRKLFEVRTGERQRGYINEFSILMIDIDHFKSINDTHGHQMGDFVLKELASLMSSLKRKEEDIGRYGGEEFYGISRGNNQSGVEFAERMRRNIENHTFSHNGTDLHITISTGVASTEEFDQCGMDSLLALADKRLYQAKHEGRNKVIGSL
ncbi:GGDEF domain-containing protein [Desulfotalea psychrophila]|uniref:diguanylate cyclase n=1 Tax=Desulfotalea psychrophila TaxID=84980 RepID=A0ABS3AUV2_9BACT|nr:GGDEF domain-containing protein [Desulfocapsa sp.]MBN4068558.1 GGDEF domain-containing protein [Desulfotalea psychrophila]MBN4071774.1 GGDEF domain-containing protein [Desulfotalea psychrophila]